MNRRNMLRTSVSALVGATIIPPLPEKPKPFWIETDIVKMWESDAPRAGVIKFNGVDWATKWNGPWIPCAFVRKEGTRILLQPESEVL